MILPLIQSAFVSSHSKMVGRGTVTFCEVGRFGDCKGEAPVPRGATFACRQFLNAQTAPASGFVFF